MDTKQVAVAKLAKMEAPYNPRSISKAELQGLRDSLESYGCVQPIIVNQATNRIVGGHARVKAAQLLGFKSLPVVFVELEELQERDLNLRLNRIGGSFDEALLGELLAELDQGGVDLQATGFTAGEIDSALEAAGLDLEPPEGEDEPDPDAQPEEPEDQTIYAQPGDVIELDAHRLVCGDMTDAEVRKALLGRSRADCVWTDPPYAIYGSSSGLAEDITDDKIARPFFQEILAASVSALKLFGHAYICCDWRSWASWWEMTKRTSLTPKNLIVWDKGSSGLGNNYANTYELVGFFARLPKQTAMGNRKTGQRPVHSPNLMRFNRPTGDDRQHNAAKPVDLVQKMIELSTDVGGLVVDWFAGSGSTLIACERANRRCRLTEIDPRYCDVTVRRWQEYTGKSAKGWRGNG